MWLARKVQPVIAPKKGEKERGERRRRKRVMDYMGKGEDVRRYPSFLRRNRKAAAAVLFSRFRLGAPKILG